jgi:serine/threonine protein kinase
MTDLSNTRLGQYQLIEAIGRGGAATVYKAHQESLDRFVAVKVLTAQRDPHFAARFKREARAIAALQHHNILPIYDYNEQDGLLYLVMQYVEHGATLGDLAGAPLAPVVALQLIGHVLDALEYAHARGVIHRDIKPTNILMPSPDWPVLADFGIAKLISAGQRVSLTPANQILGTATYMAPEQATGGPIDARTDLYAVGVVLYELMTGSVPFDGTTPMAVLLQHVNEAPPPPRRFIPDLPPTVESAILRALAKAPDARYPTAAAMAADLARVASPLERRGARSRLDSLYQAGLRAFEQGRLDEAIERLGDLVSLDPGYESAAELLQAARAAQERSKAEARQRLELIRRRRQGDG